MYHDVVFRKLDAVPLMNWFGIWLTISGGTTPNSAALWPLTIDLGTNRNPPITAASTSRIQRYRTKTFFAECVYEIRNIRRGITSRVGQVLVNRWPFYF